MNHLKTDVPTRVAADTHALVSWLPVPGHGVLPVNAYLIEAREPVLVDTGLAAARNDFMVQLESLIDPADLAWIWITHTDPDHLGNLEALLRIAPRARVITTWLGMGKMNMLGVSPKRTYLLNPGQHLDVGDRRLRALVPPVFDAPESTALVDERTGALFSADCFGALMDAPAADAAAIPAARLREGMVRWSTVDAPWLSIADRRTFARSLEGLRALAPAVVLGSHLPPARAMLDTLLGHLAAAAGAHPFTGPDQAALERMLRASPAAAAPSVSSSNQEVPCHDHA